MSYMWNKFNIKTFPAETVIFCDGVYNGELSTLESTDINKNYTRPVHIIYVGEITGKKTLEININVPNQAVFLSVDIYNKLPAFLNIFIKNTGENSELRGHVLINNKNSIEYVCNAGHFAKNTGILIQHRLIAERDSLSKLTGVANIGKNAGNCRSDISFSALADATAKIEFLPAQQIASVPENAEHSASLYTPNDEQILFLRNAGLSTAEVDDTMRDAFTHNFTLF